MDMAVGLSGVVGGDGADIVDVLETRGLLVSLSLLASSTLVSRRLSLFIMDKTPLRGRDMHKQDRPSIPEGVGLGASITFILSLLLIATLVKSEFILSPYSLPSLLSIGSTLTLTVLLGFVDDVMDLPWSAKLLFPAIALVPTILLYSESTLVHIPFLVSIDLSYAFYLCLVLLSIFFTNSINILSGVNGIESLQVLIISLFMAIDRLIFVSDRSSLSIPLSMSLFGSSLGLYLLNKYPSRCFVGDTFCYFSGVSLLAIGIVGGFTKSVFLFSLVELCNLALSIPQLTGIFPCPKHRMPSMKEGSDLLEPSYFSIKSSLLGTPLRKRLLRALTQLGLCRVYPTRNSSGSSSGAGECVLVSEVDREEFVYVSNLTLLNAILVRRGPMTEESLVTLFGKMHSALCLTALALKFLSLYL
jgi:UDP-N-acetylglucosamine--dolichyl-phosphate N-acetylglucosaminephosphotransferase